MHSIAGQYMCQRWELPVECLLSCFCFEMRKDGVIFTETLGQEPLPLFSFISRTIGMLLQVQTSCCDIVPLLIIVQISKIPAPTHPPTHPPPLLPIPSPDNLEAALLFTQLNLSGSSFFSESEAERTGSLITCFHLDTSPPDLHVKWFPLKLCVKPSIPERQETTALACF